MCETIPEEPEQDDMGLYMQLTVPNEFLEERGLKNDETAKMSMYLGQGKLIPTEQLNEAKELLTRKILTLKGNTAPTSETAIQIARYEEVLALLALRV